MDNIFEERQRRKEAFRMLHEEAKTANEDVMKRFYGLLANHNKPARIDEITIDRILSKYGDNGWINISVHKSDTPQEINDENTRSLIKDLRKSNYLYLPTYVWNEGKEITNDEYVPHFFVFNQKIGGDTDDFDKLKQFALRLCEKYCQENVLIQGPKTILMWVNSKEEEYTLNKPTIYGHYVNPMPCQLSERMRRVGEIMIWE